MEMKWRTPYESPADLNHSKGTLTMATNAEFEPWECKEGDEIVGLIRILQERFAIKWDMT